MLNWFELQACLAMLPLKWDIRDHRVHCIQMDRLGLTVSTWKSVLKNMHWVSRYYKKSVENRPSKPNHQNLTHFGQYLGTWCIFFQNRFSREISGKSPQFFRFLIMTPPLKRHLGMVSPQNWFGKISTESRDFGQNVQTFAVLVWKVDFGHFFGNNQFLRWNHESEPHFLIRKLPKFDSLSPDPCLVIIYTSFLTMDSINFNFFVFYCAFLTTFSIFWEEQTIFSIFRGDRE